MSLSNNSICNSAALFISYISSFTTFLLGTQEVHTYFDQSLEDGLMMCDLSADVWDVQDGTV